jgi:AbrB family looped-hinge helix DNA binding protein
MSERHTKIDQTGRLLIPARLRKELGLHPGADVVLEAREGELRIRSYRAAVEHAQALIRRYIPDDERSLVDELIAERRAEAARE